MIIAHQLASLSKVPFKYFVVPEPTDGLCSLDIKLLVTEEDKHFPWFYIFIHFLELFGIISQEVQSLHM